MRDVTAVRMVPVNPISIVLTLSEQVAESLLAVVGNVTGSTLGPRGDTDAVFEALRGAGVTARGSLTGILHFT